MNWKEVSLPALQTLLSTGEAQPLLPEIWPLWARTKREFSGAWYSHLDGMPATSTGTLSTANVHGYVDMERTAADPPTLRYYRYLYAKITDGRVFQAGPFKDLEYKRHREFRPSLLRSYVLTSMSTG